MKLIKAKYEIIKQPYNDLLTDMFKHIELCGRTCYKSEDRITETSYEKFINMLETSEHGAMLEHGTIYLTIPIGTPVNDAQYIWKTSIVKFFENNKFSKVNFETINKPINIEIKGYGMQTQASATFYYITTNWRVIYENKDNELLKYMGQIKSDMTTLYDSIFNWMTPPTDQHERRYTVKFTYHLGVARDVNRHRVQSIGEESTRYCNYSKEKFGAELNIIEPVFFTDDQKAYINSENRWSLKTLCRLIAQGKENEIDDIEMWRFVNLACELGYKHNTTLYNWTAQQASLMLPLDTKTESVHTAFISDWVHFFNLRALGTTGAPRPSAKEVAWPLMEDFLNNNWITLDMINSQKYNEIKNKYPNIEDYIKL